MIVALVSLWSGGGETSAFIPTPLDNAGHIRTWRQLCVHRRYCSRSTADPWADIAPLLCRKKKKRMASSIELLLSIFHFVNLLLDAERGALAVPLELSIWPKSVVLESLSLSLKLLDQWRQGRPRHTERAGASRQSEFRSSPTSLWPVV